MDNQKNEESDSRESCGLKISELLKALAERKSLPRDTTMHIDPRNIGTTLSILKNPATDTFNTHGAFRARAVPPENIRLLSKCEFKRRDHLSESLSPSVAVPAPGDLVAQSQQGQLRPSLSSLNPVIAHLVEKSKLAAADSSVEKQTKRQEIHPHVLDVMAWTKQLPCEPQCRPTQPGPTNEWFFENLTDLQRKLFQGASKKHVPRRLQVPRKDACSSSSVSTS